MIKLHATNAKIYIIDKKYIASIGKNIHEENNKLFFHVCPI